MLLKNESLESRAPRLWTVSLTVAASVLVAVVAAVSLAQEAVAEEKQAATSTEKPRMDKTPNAADTKHDTPSVQEIEEKVLEQRSAIKSGIVSLKVRTNVDKRQPVVEKIGLTYTVYFRDANFRTDEDRRLVDGTLMKYWRVNAFGRCLRSYGGDDFIVVYANERTHNNNGIFDPRLLGITARSTVGLSVGRQSDIVYRHLPIGFDPATEQPVFENVVPGKTTNAYRERRLAERVMLDGVETWRITNAAKQYRRVHWIAPEFQWSMVKYAEYVNDKVRTELVCKVQAYEKGQVYYPSEVLLHRFDERGNIIQEEITSVIQAKFNVGVPDQVFAMKALGIPAGRKVLEDNHVRIWDGEKLTSGN